VTPHPAAALLSKRWDLLAEYKDQYWRDRKKLGLRDALRVVDSLRTQARFFQPGWPTQDDREEDLKTHLRIAAALARTGPSEAKRNPPRTRKTRRPSRVARRVAGDRLGGRSELANASQRARRRTGRAA
jgi:hypothetical protein